MIRGPQLSDIGMSTYNPRPKPKPITAPKVNLSYDKPAVATYSAAQNVWTPPVGTGSYTQPAVAQPSYGGSGGYALSQPGNISSPASFAAPAVPAAPPEPPKPTEADIRKMAEVDSTFLDQKSMYAAALKKFIEDNTRQRGVIERDSDTAREGIGRNRVNGLTSLSEDFAARGLATSGLFADNLDKAGDQYDKQKVNVDTGETNSLNDLAFRKSKYEAENGANGSNVQAARREAFARLAAAQGLT